MGKKIKSITLFKRDLILLVRTATGTGDKGFKYSYTEMDKKGNILLDIKYSSNGEIEEKYVNKFDEAGNLTEEISYLTDDEIAEHKTYEFDTENKIIRAFKHYADGSKDLIHYNYDGSGNICEKITVDAENEIESKEVFEWKEKFLAKRSLYEFNELISEESNIYDDKGNRIENIKWLSEEGNTRMEYSYNDNNEIVKLLTYNDEEKLVNKTVYSYNERGQIVKSDYESVRSKNSTSIAYDERGNAIEQIEANEKGEINNQAIRKYNDQNEVVETSVIIDFHGAGINQEYILTYEYTYFDD
jgi:hypothetical protein